MGILDRFRGSSGAGGPVGPQLYVSFPTTAEAMATERACQQAGLRGKLVPVPRQLSAGCGIAWRTDPTLEASLRELLQTEDILFEAMTIV